MLDGCRLDLDTVQGPGGGASVAIVGDTEEVDTLVAAISGADALVIEATFLEADASLAKKRGCLTAIEAGRFAAEARVGALYLTI